MIHPESYHYHHRGEEKGDARRNERMSGEVVLV